MYQQGSPPLQYEIPPSTTSPMSPIESSKLHIGSTAPPQQSQSLPDSSTFLRPRLFKQSSALRPIVNGQSRRREASRNRVELRSVSGTKVPSSREACVTPFLLQFLHALTQTSSSPASAILRVSTSRKSKRVLRRNGWSEVRDIR